MKYTENLPLLCRFHQNDKSMVDSQSLTMAQRLQSTAPASTPEGADASQVFPLAATAGREDRENVNAAEEILLPRHHGRPRRTTGFHLQRQSQLLGPLFGAPGEDPASTYGSGQRSTPAAPTHCMTALVAS
jgi:hypothetical protein